MPVPIEILIKLLGEEQVAAGMAAAGGDVSKVGDAAQGAAQKVVAADNAIIQGQQRVAEASKQAAQSQVRDAESILRGAKSAREALEQLAAAGHKVDFNAHGGRVSGGGGSGGSGGGGSGGGSGKFGDAGVTREELAFAEARTAEIHKAARAVAGYASAWSPAISEVRRFEAAHAQMEAQLKAWQKGAATIWSPYISEIKKAEAAERSLKQVKAEEAAFWAEMGAMEKAVTDEQIADANRRAAAEKKSRAEETAAARRATAEEKTLLRERETGLRRMASDLRSSSYGALFIGGAGLALSKHVFDEMSEAETLRTQLSAMMRQRGEGAAIPGTQAAIQSVAERGHFAGTKEIQEAAEHLGTFELKAEQVNRLLPAVATQARAMGQSMELVANQFGKAIQTGNIDMMRRAGLVLDQNERATVKLAFAQSQEAGSAAVVNAIIERTTIENANLENSIGKAAAAVNDFTRSWHELVQGDAAGKGGEFGKGVAAGIEALAKVLHALSEEAKQMPHLTTAAGQFTVLGGGALIAAFAVERVISSILNLQAIYRTWMGMEAKDAAASGANALAKKAAAAAALEEASAKGKSAAATGLDTVAEEENTVATGANAGVKGTGGAGGALGAIGKWFLPVGIGVGLGVMGANALSGEKGPSASEEADRTFGHFQDAFKYLASIVAHPFTGRPVASNYLNAEGEYEGTSSHQERMQQGHDVYMANMKRITDFYGSAEEQKKNTPAELKIKQLQAFADLEKFETEEYRRNLDAEGALAHANLREAWLKQRDAAVKAMEDANKATADAIGKANVKLESLPNPTDKISEDDLADLIDSRRQAFEDAMQTLQDGLQQATDEGNKKGIADAKAAIVEERRAIKEEEHTEKVFGRLHREAMAEQEAGASGTYNVEREAARGKAELDMQTLQSQMEKLKVDQSRDVEDQIKALEQSKKHQSEREKNAIDKEITDKRRALEDRLAREEATNHRMIAERQNQARYEEALAHAAAEEQKGGAGRISAAAEREAAAMRLATDNQKAAKEESGAYYAHQFLGGDEGAGAPMVGGRRLGGSASAGGGPMAVINSASSEAAAKTGGAFSNTIYAHFANAVRAVARPAHHDPVVTALEPVASNTATTNTKIDTLIGVAQNIHNTQTGAAGGGTGFKSLAQVQAEEQQKIFARGFDLEHKGEKGVFARPASAYEASHAFPATLAEYQRLMQRQYEPGSSEINGHYYGPHDNTVFYNGFSARSDRGPIYGPGVTPGYRGSGYGFDFPGFANVPEQHANTRAGRLVADIEAGGGQFGTADDRANYQRMRQFVEGGFEPRMAFPSTTAPAHSPSGAHGPHTVTAGRPTVTRDHRNHTVVQFPPIDIPPGPSESDLEGGWHR